jgi:hypothetical protein
VPKFAGLGAFYSLQMVEIEQPQELDLDVPLEPVEYPQEIQTVSKLVERALLLAGVDPADVLGPRGPDV